MHAKRLLVLLLSAVLAACMLAGCDWLWWLENGDGSSSSSRPSHDGGSDSRPDPTPDPEPDPDPVLQSISVQNNRSYQVGDTFDQTSLTVTAHYDDQSQRAIEISNCEVSFPDGFDGTFTAAGDYTITVSYTEGEATQTAAVTISVTVDPNDTSTWEVRGQTLMVPRGAQSSQINKALLEQHSVTAIDLSESDLAVIEEKAFYNCDLITSIDLGNVTSIGTLAFFECDKLTYVNLSHVTSIGDSSFVGCINLSSVDLSSVTSIGNNAFATCNNLTDIRLGNRKDRALPTVGTTPFSTLQTVTVYADFSTEEEAAYQQTIAGWFNHVTIQFEPDSAWQSRASKTASLLRSALPF